MIKQIIDGGATEADGGAGAPVGLSVAMPLFGTCFSWEGNQGTLNLVHKLSVATSH